MQKVNTAQEQKHDPTQRMTKKHGFDFSISEKMCKEKHDLHFISEFYISALASGQQFLLHKYFKEPLRNTQFSLPLSLAFSPSPYPSHSDMVLFFFHLLFQSKELLKIVLIKRRM
jgi:hypothetical protein